jgi:GTP cyclohydrolase II
MSHPEPLRAVCGTLLHVSSAPVELVHGAFRIETFRNLSSRSLVLVLRHGDVRGAAPVLARVHSSCMTSESLGACDCDCAAQLDAALEAIAHAGRGVVFYLMQEGRGAGFVAKARDRMMVQASQDRVDTFDAYARMGLGRDYRRYDEVGFAAAALDITAPLVLLTNNPEKIAALQRAGIVVQRSVTLERAASPFNLHYLTAKSRSGHALSDPAVQAGAAAALPEAVTYFHPMAVRDRPRFLHVATYLLPIRAAEPGSGAHWFWLHAFFDLIGQRDRVVLTCRRDRAAVPLLRVERESLLDRFPLRARTAAALWRNAVEAIAQRGAGCALFLPHDEADHFERSAGAAETIARDADLTWLLAQHVPSGHGELLTNSSKPSRAERSLANTLARQDLDLQFTHVA